MEPAMALSTMPLSVKLALNYVCEDSRSIEPAKETR
jgi:hypothetical protein